MKTLLLSIALIAGFSIKDPGELTGRWQTAPSPKGNITTVSFKSDHSFEGFINKKPFVTGTYQFTNNIFSFHDNGCNGAGASYKVMFFSNGDSLRFQPIDDPCQERLQGMSRLVLGKIK